MLVLLERERERERESPPKNVGDGEKEYQLIRRLPASPFRPSGKSVTLMKVCGNKRLKL
jgi:hypothetical protein